MLTPAAPEDLFAPLRQADGGIVIGQIGQSLDGRIATINGRAEFINGPAGLDHLHRLRALVDAVVIGVGTAIADDPQLTVRRVDGRNPARVVIDPRGRLPAAARMLADDGVRRLIVTSETAPAPAHIETMRLAATDGQLAPADVLAALAERGLHRILIEGGTDTLSRFLVAACLDRLHIVVAPIILGGGQPGLALPIHDLAQALRPTVTAHALGNELLFDCAFARQRVPFGRAKKST